MRSDPVQPARLAGTGPVQPEAGAVAPAMSGAYISVREVSKVYGRGRDRVEAVHRASFDVPKGQFVAILGPSGCGKSTLLMMCAGLEHVSSGRIAIGPRTVDGPSRDIGIMFQDPTLLPWKTALQNVLFPIHIMGLRKAEHAERAGDLLRLVGLAGFEDKKPHQLSGGMRQRVAICRALISDPDILLMDEPFSALDAISRDEMNVLLLDIWQRYSKTGLFVTHSIREAVLLADRVLVMRRRPAAVVEDIMIPFERPRRPELGDTREFVELCAMLRRHIESQT
jgi:NitT/TauT family transport system ATP-binding protein